MTRSKKAKVQASLLTQAADRLASGVVDYRAVVTALAKSNPDVFVKLVMSVKKTKPVAKTIPVAQPKAVDDFVNVPPVPYTPPPTSAPRASFLTPTELAYEFTVCARSLESAPVAAIKKLREITGYGLKDSKDIVDAARHTMIKEGRRHVTHAIAGHVIDPNSVLYGAYHSLMTQARIVYPVIRNFTA